MIIRNGSVSSIVVFSQSVDGHSIAPTDSLLIGAGVEVQELHQAGGQEAKAES